MDRAIPALIVVALLVVSNAIPLQQAIEGSRVEPAVDRLQHHQRRCSLRGGRSDWVPAEQARPVHRAYVLDGTRHLVTDRDWSPGWAPRRVLLAQGLQSIRV